MEHSSTFGFTTNFGVISGIMLCLLMGAGLPDPVTNPEDAKDDNLWIVISLMPAVFGTINLILWLFVYRLESIKASFSAEEGSDLQQQGR